MKRAPVAAFVALAVATIAAFFFTQHLKVSTPLIAGYPSPHPAMINPRSAGTCPLLRPNGKYQTASFKRMKISFYLLNRADDVDVEIVDSAGRVIDTLASNRHMGLKQRELFTWDGRRSDGSFAPDGSYYVQVSLVHQGRSVRISGPNGDAEPVQVENRGQPVTVTGARIRGTEPAVFPQPGDPPVIIRIHGAGRRPPMVRIYRTDLPGKPRLVNSYRARSLGKGYWNGTLRNRKPAPQGTYLVGLDGVDHFCTPSRFPSSLPPSPGSTPHAGVTVRYLAVQPPMRPIAPGKDAPVEVDARHHNYRWALRRAGSATVLRSGSSSAVSLKVPLPAGAPALYELAVKWGHHRTVVPLVAGGSAGPHKVLVVLPALTWQGLNPVDDDGDGMPNTLTLGQPIRLERPLVDGLPAGTSDEAAFLSYLRSAGLRFDLTTDLDLPSRLGRYSGIVFAGSERWLPSDEGSQLSTYVEQGGHVLSLGIDALRRTVSVSGDQALDPSAPHAVDTLLARPGRVQRTGGSLILVDRDRLHIFSGTAQALPGYKRYQAFGPVQSPATVLSSAGVTAGSSAVLGYRLGHGDVVDIGLPGFGSSLAHDVDGQELVGRVWKLLSR